MKHQTGATFPRLVEYIESGKSGPSLLANHLPSEFQRAQTDFMVKTYIGKLVVMPNRFFRPVQA